MNIPKSILIGVNTSVRKIFSKRQTSRILTLTLFSVSFWVVIRSNPFSCNPLNGLHVILWGRSPSSLLKAQIHSHIMERIPAEKHYFLLYLHFLLSACYCVRDSLDAVRVRGRERWKPERRESRVLDALQPPDFRASVSLSAFIIYLVHMNKASGINKNF